MKKINVALVGLGFGSCFVPIWLDHPNVGEVTVCDKTEKLLLEMKERYPRIRITTSFEEVLKDETIDAVHLVTPIPLHADQSVAVLESGKHCACTVPMATSLEDIRRIVAAKRKSGKNYMMMETTLYTYQFFYVRQLLEKGELGKIQFLRGSHYQDMVGWPPYWMGLPPMWYGTHAIGPMVVLSGDRIRRTVAFGSGTMEPELHEQYGNPYPVETALFDFGNGLKGEATRNGDYCRVPVEHKATLGEIVDLIYAFHDQPATLMMPEIPCGSFAKKLYSTYLSYLPADKAIFDLKMNVDERGSFTELLKTASCGQFSVNISKPGITKGQHWHHTKWEFFMVVSGVGRIEQRKIGTDEVLTFDVSGERIQAVQMLPGYTHNIINLSDTQDLVTVMWANELFDPNKPDTFFEKV